MSLRFFLSDDAAQVQRLRHGLRADGRGELVKALIERQFEKEKLAYIIDWFGFRLANEEPFLMVDPFQSYKGEIRGYVKGLPQQEPLDREGLYNS